jgi:uncharacterized SAM-binding protein YcdF (DUF218 family)
VLHTSPRIFLMLTAIGLCAITFSQTVLISKKVTRTANDLSPGRALEVADRFLSSIGASEDFSKAQAALRKYYGGKKWTIAGPKGHQVDVDASHGRVTMYYNFGRSDDQYRRRGRTGKQRFTNEADAKQYVRNLATKLGIPTDTVMTNFSWKKDGQVKDANSAGSFGAVFVDAQGNLRGTVSCDPQDGVLVVFTRRY